MQPAVLVIKEPVMEVLTGCSLHEAVCAIAPRHMSSSQLSQQLLFQLLKLSLWSLGGGVLGNCHPAVNLRMLKLHPREVGAAGPSFCSRAVGSSG